MKLLSRHKFLFIALVLGLVVIGLSFLVKNLGDIRPALLPPNFEVPQNLSHLQVPDGYSISLFAHDLPGARDLELSPGGTLLLSQTSAGKVVTLPDKKVVLENLNDPHGLAFYDGMLFVAEKDNVSRYLWAEDSKTATFDKKLFDLPSGGGHHTRSLLFTKTGDLLVSTGSSCNVCIESDPMRAAVFVSDVNGTPPKLFAKGLRNAVFMTLHPETSEVWATEMGRDLLGDDLPPEEINIIKQGNDYGWPYCYGNKVRDVSFAPETNFSCATTTPPLFTFQAHSAPLGLAFDSQGDLLVAYHGSWNRSTPTGYKIVKMHVENGKITQVEDFLTGFIQDSTAQGRPVDIIENSGTIFISDDKAGAIYKLEKK